MRKYYIETDFGCTVREANNEREVRAEIADEIGRLSIRFVREATKEDAAWVAAMGGRTE